MKNDRKWGGEKEGNNAGGKGKPGEDLEGQVGASEKKLEGERKKVRTSGMKEERKATRNCRRYWK